jgi:hypothetical protein
MKKRLKEMKNALDQLRMKRMDRLEEEKLRKELERENPGCTICIIRKPNGEFAYCIFPEECKSVEEWQRKFGMERE